MTVSTATWTFGSDIESKNTWEFNGKVLVLWSGGREHALAWKIAQSSNVQNVFTAPGNPGMQEEDKIENVDMPVGDIDAILKYIEDNQIGLTVVGPEQPLVDGLVDAFYEKGLDKLGLKIFWPSKAAAQLEGSKDFTKQFCMDFDIPTADYNTFTELKAAKEYATKMIIGNKSGKVVIKADGLATWKGVIVAENQQQAYEAIDDMLEWNKFWEAGHKVVIEEFLEGEEVSAIFMIDINGNIIPMATSQDHKPRDEGNTGPNTGWMGAYSPADHILGMDGMTEVMEKIIKPTVEGMEKRETPFSGFLYAGLMVTEDGPKLLEYNVRFGDPETQAIMMRLNDDFLDMCLAGASGELDSIDPTKQDRWDTRCAINVVLAAVDYPNGGSTGEPIILPKIDDEDVKIFHAGTQLWDEDRLETKWGRVLGVTVIADTIKEANEKANAIIDQISEATPGVFFARRDIWNSAITYDEMQELVDKENEV